MDTIKKILHPKDSFVHTTDDTTDTVATKHHEEGTTTTTAAQHTNKEPFPYEVQRDRLDREAGFDPTDTSTPQPRAGHHHPRQPVGATGLPPNHQPRQNFASPQQGATGGGGALAGSSSSSSHINHGDRDRQPELASLRKQQAEEGNNFPGTNPHPAHSALGNQSMTGEKGTMMPGRE